MRESERLEQENNRGDRRLFWWAVLVLGLLFGTLITSEPDQWINPGIAAVLMLALFTVFVLGTLRVLRRTKQEHVELTEVVGKRKARKSGCGWVATLILWTVITLVASAFGTAIFLMDLDWSRIGDF